MFSRLKRFKGALFVSGWLLISVAMLLFIRQRVRMFDVYVTNGTANSVERVLVICGDQEQRVARVLAGQTVRLRIRPPTPSALKLSFCIAESEPIIHLIPGAVSPGDGGQIHLTIEPDHSISVVNELESSRWW